MQAILHSAGDLRLPAGYIEAEFEELQVLEDVLESRCIKPIYQPIVSLTDGEIFGYEALSRIADKKLDMNILQLFRIAQRGNKTWELEKLCRERALENSANMDRSKRLFLNVDPNVIHDEKFRDGFTKKRLNQYELNSDNVIFEITERVAVTNNEAFIAAVYHYKNQDYGIAIDDVGAGFSGLNTIVDVKPQFMKLDLNLVRDIDKDEIKQLLCKAMVDFGKNAGIQLIAEGIETEEELKTLIKLKIDLGQGYFLGIPQETFENIAPVKEEMIVKYHSKHYSENIRISAYPAIEHLSRSSYVFSPDENIEVIHKTLKADSAITEFTIVKDGTAVGFMTKTDFNEMLGGRYGFYLHSKKKIEQVMKTDFLRVNYNMPIDQVSRIAMQRAVEQLYNPIVVEKEDKYMGIVTIKGLLEACTKIEIDTAMHTNTLTKLPGNLLIEREISHRMAADNPYCIIYIDLDNFKAYNDAYGFQNGDLMLTLTADILKECALKNEFVGHIGGDDFIMICDYHEAGILCMSIINDFSSRVVSLYSDEDLKSGSIIAKNRHGVTETFPIVTLSIAGISNKAKTYRCNDEFSKDISQLKKKCKRQTGSYFEIL
ncbi:MAG: GGDEF domain-containing protein [Chitinispirillia bacterium]|nr:GGDEF domain-containing protein [Chitinispirillia bacterium]